MALSLYDATVANYLQILGGLSGVLDRGLSHFQENNIDPESIVEARLAPDMFTFTRQVQIATDMAKGTCARLSGQEAPRFEDNETTFPELKARVAKTLAFLESLPVAAFDGAETRKITLKLGPPGKQIEREFVGLAYLQGFGTPNVYFHYSMVYALLRHNGMALGKPDYVG